MLKKFIKAFVIIFAVIFVINIIRYYSSKGNVALIKISGIITDSKAKSWIDEIHNAKSNDSYKAVLIVINSPGGSANASERLYIAIKNLNKTKPVVALIDDIGASGAYYAAVGADKIVAYPTSVVGSIGVLFETVNVSGLSEKLGISSFVVKSGKVKDAGNPLRKPTKADIAMLQDVVNGIYEQFLSDVAKSRHIKEDVLRKYADGRVFYAKKALKIGLIDAVGTKATAENIIKKKAHIKHIELSKLESNKSFLSGLTDSEFFYFLNYLRFKFLPTAKAVFYD